MRSSGGNRGNNAPQVHVIEPSNQLLATIRLGLNAMSVRMDGSRQK